jgi:hypothetical protein
MADKKPPAGGFFSPCTGLRLNWRLHPDREQHTIMPTFPAHRLADIAPFHVMELMARAKELEAGGRDIIHMEVGEPDFPTPPPIVAAAQAHIATAAFAIRPHSACPNCVPRSPAFMPRATASASRHRASSSPPALRADCCWRWPVSPNRAANGC